MKKIILTVLAAVAVTASFAQNPKIDKEIRATKSYDAGLAILNEQIGSLTDEQKGKAYDELYKLIKEDAIKSSVTQDYEALIKGLNAASEGAKIGSKNGKANLAEIAPIRGLLINAANSTEDNNMKLKYSLAYINSAEPNDANVKLANFFAGFANYQNKNYKEAAKYAKDAMGDERVNDMAEQVFSFSMRQSLQTKADTMQFVNTLKEMNFEKYFIDICNILDESNEQDMINKMVAEAIAQNSNNKVAYFFRAQTKAKDNKLEEAIADYKKSVEIDPAFEQGWFNLGLCYASKGEDIQLNKADKNGRLLGDNLKECNEAFTNAIEAFEKVRELDPGYEKVKWPMQLRKCYIAVGKKDKADEISKMLGDL